MVAIEEIFSYQFSFADIEADKYIEYRRSHADPRIHAMDRLTNDVVDELVKLCLPFYHKKNGLAVQAGRPYMRLEMMVRLHLLQISLNYSDLQMEVYLTSDVARGSSVECLLGEPPFLTPLCFASGECQDCCVWGGYSRGSPTRLPFPFCDVVCQT